MTHEGSSGTLNQKMLIRPTVHNARTDDLVAQRKSMHVQILQHHLREMEAAPPTLIGLLKDNLQASIWFAWEIIVCLAILLILKVHLSAGCAQHRQRSIQHGRILSGASG